jgi:hypothetical protein
MLLHFIKKYKYLFLITVFIIVYTFSKRWNEGKERKERKEGFDINRFSELDSDKNPDVYPCRNYCGPKAECVVTREQCVKDNDCSNCYNSNFKNDKISESFTNINTMIPNRGMYDSMETSSLTTDASTFATVIKKDAAVPKVYLGTDLWTKSFNYGLGLSEKNLQYDMKRCPDKYKFVPKYEVTETATGMFYNTGPIAANS